MKKKKFYKAELKQKKRGERYIKGKKDLRRVLFQESAAQRKKVGEKERQKTDGGIRREKNGNRNPSGMRKSEKQKQPDRPKVKKKRKQGEKRKKCRRYSWKKTG